MSDDGLTLRTLTTDDLPALSDMLARAFLADPSEGFQYRERLVFEPERSHGVFEGDELIGMGEILTRKITVPGAGPTPFAGITSVGVAPGHRRRGALTRVMRAQLHGLHDDGAEPIAALWASEAVIYPRFGYGLAAQFYRAKIRAKSAFRPGVELEAERVREVGREQAIPLIKAIYEKEAPQRVGALDRPGATWEFNLDDPERRRNGATAFRFAVLPDGYVIYRVKNDWNEEGPRGILSVQELVATTPEAYATLYRFLLDYDLVVTVEVLAALDEPLVHLLANPRAMTRSGGDSLWLRLVDVDRALVTRHYNAPVDLVFGVRDAFCPWNTGNWRLVAGADGDAEVTRVEDAPDLELDVTDLGAIFLGGTRPSTLAAAGRIKERTAGAVSRATAAFAADREPSCLESF
ncbi:GNAT family N-acetyltransferase [Amycolatopsis keratiniphila]|uniref:GNAT family N-acetyltransferase n=1 Tax=Amycolatopsis keratiniphila TaxID=129921 RepID=UPI000907795C|nr:GNAT family N-acetyltransferase [Amycolatopsis keratiniphila]OLZ44202.1 GNAT family N-acetyltransferase [Amycolatopsis keratiniphila subsp. nogabecina]